MSGMPRGLIGLVLAVVLGSVEAAVETAPFAVPAQYAQLYQKLEGILDAELARQAQARPVAARPRVSVDLLAANANRGPALLTPENLDVVRLSLDRFREIGIGCVKFALHYPLLRPDFPRQAEYLAFYKQVVIEARQRGIKVMPHMTVMFSDTPFSSFKGLHRGLDLERFKREYRDMAHLVARELKPDYLALLTEPDTHARLTGLKSLNDPVVFAGVIGFVLQGLDRGATVIGAGSGSWSSLEFARQLAEKTTVDAICIHVYPITGPMLGNAREMARIARAHHKQAIVDEAWLYKVLKPGGGDGVAATADVFRRDVASFWQPLDEKFIRMMLGMAGEEGIGMVSFFWSGLFFANLEYSPELDRLSYAEVTQRHNREIFAAMQAGRLNALGRFVKRALTGGSL
ncbi:MAG: hypothetical protein L0Y32_00960 [Nevskiales bacterium]|nr:hypothetical protein [Nevskiales bacterium]